jgi:hypothetical protein
MHRSDDGVIDMATTNAMCCRQDCGTFVDPKRGRKPNGDCKLGQRYRARGVCRRS